MEKTITLQPKQLAVLNQIQQQKQQINATLQELNKKEITILELIFEITGITDPVSNIRMDGNSLIFDVEPTVKEVKKVKPK